MPFARLGQNEPQLIPIKIMNRIHTAIFPLIYEVVLHHEPFEEPLQKCAARLH